MFDRPWWMIALQWAGWAVTVFLVAGWLNRSRFRVRSPSKERQLAHPPATLFTVLVCFLSFAGIAVVMNVAPNETTTWWLTTFFVGLALLCVPCITEYFVGRHQVSEDGMAYRTFVGTRKYLRWSELRAVRYALGMKYFRLETGSGEVARISAGLMGLPEFARLLLAHSPKEAIEPETLPVLQATADGHPPSFWA